MALLFLKLGAIGFGGGMAVISMMEQECVRRYHCVEAEEFLHGVGLGQILGPFAVNASLFVGYRLYGPLGALVAATAFMLPSVALVTVLSWLYFTYHEIPSLQGALTGVGPVVIALIVGAAISMGRTALKTVPAVCLAVLGFAASAWHQNPVWVLAAAGIAGILLGRHRREASSQAPASRSSATPLVLATLPQPLPVAAAGTVVSLSTLMSTFLKIGLVFFGGGFVLIPVLQHKLVEELAWLTQREFIDGLAISQLTPGPLAVLATFTGYRVGGVLGGLVATAALFAPAVLLMLLICHFYQALRNLAVVKDFLGGVVPAVVGLVAAAAVPVGSATLGSGRPAPMVLALVSLWLLSGRKWHPAIVLALGALAGSLFTPWFV